MAIGLANALPVLPADENKNNEGIHFVKGTWAEIVALAKKENKPIFVDCYTVWCGPCKTLAKKVFPQKEVGDYFNANYISYKIDMEKGEGPALKEKFGVSAYPTLLFIDSSSEDVMHKMVGAGSAAQLLENAKKAPEEAGRVSKLETLYKKDKNDLVNTKAYLAYLIKSHDTRAEAVALDYLKLIPENELYKKQYSGIISKYVKNPFSREAKVFIENKEKFIAENNSLAYFEGGLYYKHAQHLTDVETKKAFDQKEFNRLTALMKERGNSEAITKRLKEYTQKLLCMKTGDWSGYMDIIEPEFNEGLNKNPSFYLEKGYVLLNNINNYICKDPAIYERAVNIQKKALDIELAREELNLNMIKIIYSDLNRYAKESNLNEDYKISVKAISEFLTTVYPKLKKQAANAGTQSKQTPKKSEKGKTLKKGKADPTAKSAIMRHSF